MTDKPNITASSYNYDRSSYIVLPPIVRDPVSGKLATASSASSSVKK